jgi:Fe-S-cluster-containing hydrogenase component 2
MNLPVQSALAVYAGYPAPAPVPAIEYRSQGRLLVIGNSSLAVTTAAKLAADLPVTLLHGDAAPQASGFASLQGEIVGISGWLGEFSATWRTPGDAIQAGEFDMVLNLTERLCFTMHQPPQGYFAPLDENALELALEEIRDGIGEFEKPKFFLYNEKTCAHSRSRLDGCNRCVDICSTKAISAAGDHIRVEAHLCMGCGACATVCPSGAMQYNFPSVSYWGGKLKAMLEAYRAEGGEDACLLLHERPGGWSGAGTGILTAGQRHSIRGFPYRLARPG